MKPLSTRNSSMVWTLVLAVCSVGLACVLVISMTTPDAAPQAAKAPQAAVASWTWSAPPPLGDSVDWSAIDVSPDAAPLAIAAYELGHVEGGEATTSPSMNNPAHTGSAKTRP